MRRLSDAFAEAAGSCVDLAELRSLLSDAATELGFHYFALLDHSALSAPGANLIRLDNYPNDWSRELVQSGLVSHDPVHQASRRCNAGFEWSKLAALIPLERSHEHILSRSRFHGLGDGFTVPANVPNEPSASCSFAVRSGRDLPERSLRCAELVGAHALRAARRLRPFEPPPRRRLSRRELDCLRLLAIGKTDWEIAKILGLSIETVHQYVKRARSAYGAASRVQLVLHGLRDGWISIEDAIPPNG